MYGPVDSPGPYSFPAPHMRPFTLIIAVILGALACVAAAHPPVATWALVDVKADGRVDIAITHDAIAFVLNDTSARIGDPEMRRFLVASADEVLAACDDGRSRLLVGVKLTADGLPVPIEVVAVPTPATFEQWKADNPSQRLPCKLESTITAQLPVGTRELTIRFPEILSEILVELRRPDIEPLAIPLMPAEVSPRISLNLPPTTNQPALPSPSPQHPDSSLQEGTSRFGIFARFTKLGFTHIIPSGLDHCLFVLGLFLLSPRAKPVLWQITSFTVAHTVTLTLTSLNIIGLPAAIVEPAIALSVAFIGVENLLTKKVQPWRPAVAFLFGLLHGMGVATAFTERSFPEGQLVQSLAAFTVGVEGGHITVLVAAFALLGWTRNRPWYRTRVAIPASLAIAAIATVWFVQRIFN